MSKKDTNQWNFDDWMNHILFGATILALIYSFFFLH